MNSNNIIIIDNNQFQNLVEEVNFIFNILNNSESVQNKKEDKLLNTKEASTKLKVCSKTVISYIESGQLKAVKYNQGKRGRYKILTSEIERYIKTHRLGY